MMRCLVVLLLAGTAFAGPGSGVVRRDSIEVELVSEHLSVQPGGEIHAGLRMQMDFGWHVYWRNAGDAGAEPTIKWSLPEGFVAGPIQWPAPHRIPIGGLMNYGYEGEVLLPVTIRAPQELPGSAVRIEAKVDWQVCEEICILGEADLGLFLPVNTAAPKADERWRELFARTRRGLPRDPPPGRIWAAVRGDALVLTWEEPVKSGNVEFERMVFFPTDDGMIENAASQPVESLFDADALRKSRTVVLTPVAARTEPLTRLVGVLVIGSDDARTAYTIDVPIGEAPRRLPAVEIPLTDLAPESPARPRPFASLELRHAFVLLGGVLMGFVLIWVIRKRGRPAG